MGIVRRVNLLTTLVLLLSGLLQPLWAAQGVTCARTHSPAHLVQQPDNSMSEMAVISRDGDGPVGAVRGEHSSIPQPGDPSAVSAPCGVAAVPTVQRFDTVITTARHLLPPGDLPAASFLIQSLFRPPRLS